MVLGGVAIDANVMMYGNNAGETVCYLVHVHPKDILGHLLYFALGSYFLA